LSRKKLDISEKDLWDVILSFLRKQESSIFRTFLDSRFRGSDRKAGFSEISIPNPRLEIIKNA
jgi:hypothetical protein